MVDPFKLNEFMDEAFNKGIRQEQERIIKLLENTYWHDIYFPSQERYATKPAEELIMAHQENCIGCEAIALIKGETK